ncbi:Acetolactate synthase-1/2/3 large subunit [Chelatococcus asaccharovorans]|nr:Acetolactate synthase-1/2/3 large subunit [Chelatococcus asaccharovorans]CAH1687648.1 Acetolactate synthase-1/2/3 large subunit [Chelatococcus asaccharovorans]
MPGPADMTGAQLFARTLSHWDCGPVFHVPGEGILEALDALADVDVPLIACRHEAGMAYMAQAAGHVRGKPGICLAGRAPGALNATLALHTAFTDAAPMILIIGQPPMRQAGREPFLDNDFSLAFAPVAKWIGTCSEAARLPEILSRAWATVMSGQRGPVVVAINEDVWVETVDAPVLAPPIVARPRVPAADADAIARLLAGADNPVLVVGGTGWSEAGVTALRDFAETTGLPVVTSYRRRDLMPADHPCFAGELGIGADPAILDAVARADLVIVAGMRLGEINTFGAGVFEGFRLLAAPEPTQTLVHIHPDASELNRVYRAALPVCAEAETLFEPLGRALTAHSLPDWSEWRLGLRAARETFATGRPGHGPLDLRAVCRVLREALPPDAMLTVGAGAYAHWPQRYFPHTVYGTQLGPKSGAMGYGLSAAIGVQASCPGRRVVAMAGDGCFLMHGEELATAVLHKLPVTVIVVNNNSYGAIAASQTRHFGRTVGTDLAPVDLAAYARAFGAAGFRVETTADFAPALASALATDGPALIELMTGPEALRP